jgi:hypothetical protein
MLFKNSIVENEIKVKKEININCEIYDLKNDVSEKIQAILMSL